MLIQTQGEQDVVATWGCDSICVRVGSHYRADQMMASSDCVCVRVCWGSKEQFHTVTTMK